MADHKLSVCAMAPPGTDLTQQDHGVVDIVSLPPGGEGASGAISQAARTGASWIWLVADSIVPRPDALQQLVSAAHQMRAVNRLALLASKVMLPDGCLDLGAAPWPRMLARELSLIGAEHRMVALRAVRYGSILVRREVVERYGPPRRDFTGAGDDLEWTGRILRDESGFLVPQSVVTRSTPLQVDYRRYIRNRVRILRGGAWTGQERVWFAYVLVGDVLSEVVNRPAQLPGTIAALAGGLRAPVPG